MFNEADPRGSNIFDHVEDIGEFPAIGTPGEIEPRADISRRSELLESMENGALGELAREQVDKGNAVGFMLRGPRKIRMFVGRHPHEILAAGAVGLAAVTAIVLYEHHKGKK